MHPLRNSYSEIMYSGWINLVIIETFLCLTDVVGQAVEVYLKKQVIAVVFGLRGKASHRVQHDANSIS